MRLSSVDFPDPVGGVGREGWKYDMSCCSASSSSDVGLAGTADV